MNRTVFDFSLECPTTPRAKKKFHSGFRSRKYRLTIYGIVLITIGCSLAFWQIDVDQYQLQVLSIWSTSTIGLIMTYCGAQMVQKFKDSIGKKPATPFLHEDETDPESTPL